MSQVNSPAEHIVDCYKQKRDSGMPPIDAWEATYRWWIQENPTGKGDPFQSWKSASGKAFERIVIAELSRYVGEMPSPLRVFAWSEIDENIQQGVLAERVWKPGDLKQPVVVPSMVDVVVGCGKNEEELDRIVAVYSCKTSLAERYQQDLFWAQRFRERRIRFCLVTLDEACVRYATTGTGLDAGKTGKSLRLAVALYDRIYLFTPDPIRNDPQVFRRIEDLVEDLRRWSEAL